MGHGQAFTVLYAKEGICGISFATRLDASDRQLLGSSRRHSPRRRRRLYVAYTSLSRNDVNFANHPAKASPAAVPTNRGACVTCGVVGEEQGVALAAGLEAAPAAKSAAALPCMGFGRERPARPPQTCAVTAYTRIPGQRPSR
eukprot:6181155-Pleurochrysis_carterae.AAC.1